MERFKKNVIRLKSCRYQIKNKIKTLGKKCRADVVAPQIINRYNKLMGGIDSMDILIVLHSIPFKSKRWYSRVTWRTLDLMAINSWIIVNSRLSSDENYSFTSHRKLRLFHFKSEIAKFLLTKSNISNSYCYICSSSK